MYYKLMIKRDSFFSMWYKEFGSNDKDKVESMYHQILRSPNIEAN